MVKFIRARTEEQYAERKEMILKACEEVYLVYGLNGVTFNTIASKTSFTRPAIYNYYNKKETILLELLQGKFGSFQDELRHNIGHAEGFTKERFCSTISITASRHETAFKLLSDRFTFEKECPPDAVKEMEAEVCRSISYLGDCTRNVVPGITEDDKSKFCRAVSKAYQYSYPLSHLEKAQVEAAKENCPELLIPDLRETVYKGLMIAL